MVRFEVPARSAGGALRFSVEPRAVLFAGSRHGRVARWVCRGLIEQFARRGFSFFVGCARGVDASFRAALAAGGHQDRVFVGCALRRRALLCRTGGLYASVVVPEGISAKAALARRTLWLVRRCSLAVLFPESPRDGSWGPGSRLLLRSALYHLKPLFVKAPAKPAWRRR